MRFAPARKERAEGSGNAKINPRPGGTTLVAGKRRRGPGGTMAATRFDDLLGATLHQLRQDPRPDSELLACFLNDGDQHAFEALLIRHTPAVRAACRGWLRAAPDIADAAQATFLVRVQRARSIRDRTALGRWLYGVAANVARRLRRQRRAFRPVPDDLPGREPAGDAAAHELVAAEVARLA